MPIRRSPTADPQAPPQPGRDHPEWVVAINRNAWSQSIGISGRNQSVRADNERIHPWRSPARTRRERRSVSQPLTPDRVVPVIPHT